MTTQSQQFTDEYPQRRPYHLLVGSMIFTLAYAFVVALVRVTLLPRSL